MLKVDWNIDVFNAICLASGNSNDELCAHIEIRLLPCSVLHTHTHATCLKTICKFYSILTSACSYSHCAQINCLLSSAQTLRHIQLALCVCFSFVFIWRNKLIYRSQLKLLKQLKLCCVQKAKVSHENLRQRLHFCFFFVFVAHIFTYHKFLCLLKGNTHTNIHRERDFREAKEKNASIIYMICLWGNRRAEASPKCCLWPDQWHD